jgi:lysophospholipase L1-like esterase
MPTSRHFLAGAGFALALAAPAYAARTTWVTSWFASPQPLWDSGFILPTNVPAILDDQSVREVVQLSAGGNAMRVVLSNRYGDQPLVIGEVRVAPALHGAAVVGGSEHVLTFGGQRSVTVPPGAPAISDPVEMTVAPLSRLAITTYFPQRTSLSTFHWGAQQTGYIAAGDATGAGDLPQASLLTGRAFLSAVLVEATGGARTVVAFGDSLTDGNGSTPDLNRRWPDYLAARLARRGIGVANAGISGARVLGDRMGVNALARFEQDVLSQPGVDTVVVLMGINDIGWPGSPFAPDAAQMTAAELIAGYRQLAAAAQARKVRIVGATMPPFEGALQGTPFEGHYSPAKDALRREVNEWIRHGGAFDAVADFDAVTRDPRHPSRLLPAYDSGDHLHPGDAGYRAMADALSLRMLFGD